MSENICIIGCGIAGLYTTFRCIQSNPNNIIHIYEKNKTIGGRCMTRKWHNTNIELGAGIFNPSHTNLINLLKELNIPYSTFESQFFIGVRNDTNQDYKLDKYFDYDKYEKQKNKITNLIQKKIDEILLQNNGIMYLQNISFKVFIKTHFHIKIWKWIVQYSMFQDYFDENMFYIYPSVINGQQFYSKEKKISHSIKGGWNVLLQEFMTYLRKNKNITFYFNKPVTEIEYIDTDDTFIIDTKQYNKVYVCGDFDVKFIQYKNMNVSFLNVFDSIPLLRVYAYNENGEFDNCNNLFVPNNRKIICINKNVQMIAYLDSNNVYRYISSHNLDLQTLNKETNLLTKLSHTNSFENIIKKYYKYNTNYENKVKYHDIKIKYWPNGVHIRKPYNQYDNVVRDNNGKRINMYFLGEMVSDTLGFVEGAIQSVNDHFNKE